MPVVEIKDFVRRYGQVTATTSLILVAATVYTVKHGLVPDSIEMSFFYASILAMTGFVAYRMIGSESQEFLDRATVFMWFSATFLATRLMVRTAEIGHPTRPAGSVMGVPLNQLWIGGYHIHHYFVGLVLIVMSTFAFRHGKKSRVIGEVFFGAGLGLLFDEIGFLLSMGNYSSPATYPLTLGMAIVLFAYVNIDRKN